MAIEEWELWACAHELIRQHGGDAPLHAALRAERLLLKGDAAGCTAWRRIGVRAGELLEGSKLLH